MRKFQAGTRPASQPCPTCLWCALGMPETSMHPNTPRELLEHACLASIFRSTIPTPQGASAFNQPLSFDTSKVTTMNRMFHVRPRVCPVPNEQSDLSLAHTNCTATAHPNPSSARFVCQPFDLVGSVGVQPAAEPRHVQRHKHRNHVFGALRARAMRSMSTRTSHCSRLHPTPLSRPLACVPSPSSYTLLSTR